MQNQAIKQIKKILNQVFFLENMFEIDLCLINFYQLLEEKSFILSYQIIKNEFDILLKILVNFEANDFIFINIFCIINVIKFLNIIICLSISAFIMKYDDKSNLTIIHIIVLHF